MGKERLGSLARGVPNVILPGWVDGPALQMIMKRSFLGLTPYRNRSNFVENLPNKFLEYLSQGLPILSSLGGYSRQLLEEAGVGLFYQEKDPSGLAHAVGRLLAAPQERAAMGRSARKLYENRFRADVVYGNLADLLEEIAHES